MPPVLSIVSGLPGFKKRIKTKRKSRITKGVKGLSCPSLRSRFRLPHLGIGNVFHCATKRRNVDSATHHHLTKDMINRHYRINKIMDRYGVKKLKFKPTTKGRKIKRKKKTSKVNLKGLLGFGNLLGVGKMIKKRRGCAKKKSLGRRIACRKKIPKGRCRKVGRRTVCKRKVKAFIRRDIVGRKHSSSGRLLPIGSFGLAGQGFRGDSCAHRVVRAGYGGWRKPRRKGHRRGGLGNFGFGAISVPSSVKSFFPPIDKEIAMRGLTVISGAVAPITIQNMVVPIKWRTGILGLLTYTLIGGGLVAISKKIEFLRPKQADIGLGVVVGIGYQIFQNYILKRSLIPVANPTAPTVLKGVDACASCQNAGDCADVGDCLGYSDGINDDLEDELEDELLDDDFGNDLEDDLEDELLEDALEDELEDDSKSNLRGIGDYITMVSEDYDEDDY